MPNPGDNRLKRQPGSAAISSADGRTIEVSTLKKAYGSLQAVDGISFSVDEGEVFSLLGPNGAGKTTTIEILEGLRERDAGDAKVLGKDPWKEGYELHKKIGVIPQGFKFVDYATPREAINYYAALFGVKVDADAILKRVILEDSANVYFSKLSGGRSRRWGWRSRSSTTPSWSSSTSRRRGSTRRRGGRSGRSSAP